MMKDVFVDDNEQITDEENKEKAKKHLWRSCQREQGGPTCWFKFYNYHVAHLNAIKIRVRLIDV